jgi:hypothetical protein
MCQRRQHERVARPRGAHQEAEISRLRQPRQVIHEPRLIERAVHLGGRHLDACHLARALHVAQLHGKSPDVGLVRDHAQQLNVHSRLVSFVACPEERD